MWVLKRTTEGSNDTDNALYHLIVGEYLVGRKDCQIQVSGDQTVSRKHAYITVNQDGDSPTAPARVSLKDVSKYGTSVNGSKCKNSVSLVLKHGDEVTFGTQGSLYRLNYEPLVVFASCLDSSKKKMLKAQIRKLGGYMVGEWQKECTHLVMDALSFTVKVIYALVMCCPIVTVSYFEDLLEAIDSKSDLPETEKYMPPIKEELIDSQMVSFQPNEARKSIFTGKRFLFLEPKQHKRLHTAITLAGGTSLLKECGDIPGDDDLLMDENTLVMSVDPKLKIPADKELWIGHVGEILTSCNRRPIPETEVGLAILHLSLEEYCNSSVDHIPSLTKHIVSKSLSTMEAMSQRFNESQSVSVMPVLKKEPFSCTTKADQPRKTRSKVSTETKPHEAKKRSRGNSDDALPLANDTPLSENVTVETKRQKLSTSETKHFDKEQKKPATSEMEVTHISQSQQDSASLTDSQRRKKRLKLTPPKTKVTHISQSQHSQMQVKVSDSPSDSPDEEKGDKLGICKAEVSHISQSERSQIEVRDTPTNSEEKGGKLAIPKADVTHISQSECSQKVRDTPTDSLGKKGKKVAIPKADVTHISQSERSQRQPKVNDTPIDSFGKKGDKVAVPKTEVTHISQSQRSQMEEKSSNISMDSPSDKKRKLSRLKTEVTHISQSQRSQPEVDASPSPEIPFDNKRRKLTSRLSLSQTQRSQPDGRGNRSVTDNSSDLEESDSNAINLPKRSNKQGRRGRIQSDGFQDKTNSRTTSTIDNNQHCPSDAEIDDNHTSFLKSEDSPVSDGGLIERSSTRQRKPGDKDSCDESPRIIPLRSGWLSAKSRPKGGNSETHQNSTTDSTVEDRNGVVGDSVEVNKNLSHGVENGFVSQKLTGQGFLSEQDEQKGAELTVVKQEAPESDLPSDLVCIEHVELVVARSVTRRNRRNHVTEKKCSSTLKNMKRFRKQNYTGDGTGIPRIIGGSDLVVFSSGIKGVEDWFLEVQEMNRERDIEDQNADNLFRYEPSTTKRRNRR